MKKNLKQERDTRNKRYTYGLWVREFIKIQSVSWSYRNWLITWTCGVANFKVSPTTCHDKVKAVEVVALPKVTTNAQFTVVPFDNNWNHLSNLQLADPDFGTPRNIDLILVADMFSNAVLYGWWFRPSGLPSAFKTAFRWVLAGTNDECSCKHPIVKVCCWLMTIRWVVIHVCRCHSLFHFIIT